MLVELAIGDAYGAGFEYVRDHRFVRRHNDLTAYVKHPTHDLEPGCYTDDTQMSIAIAELIVERVEWTPENIAARFVDVFHRDRRPGYSSRFYKFLKSVRTGRAFLDGIKPDSDKSGAAMRAAPIGVFADTAEVIDRCRVQAMVTHNTPDGIRAALVVSLATHYFLHGLGDPESLIDFVSQHAPGDWREPWLGEVGSRGWMSVRAALTSLRKSESMSGVLKSCVSWTGDVDTVACIALAIASCSGHWKADLPDVLYRRLENGAYGLDFLKSLDARLARVVEREKRGRTRSHGRLPE